MKPKTELTIDRQIREIDKVICSNIEKLASIDRGLSSQNILAQLRTFVEHISLKVYGNGRDIKNDYANIRQANAYIKQKRELNFLSKFHKLLQVSASHYTLDPDSSERLMLKYYDYLLRIKAFLKNSYHLEVLKNLHAFPLHTDTVLSSYYKKIAEQLELPHSSDTTNVVSRDRYYIQKIKPFFVDNKIYYEVTFTRASDTTSKFDHVIAFTRCQISSNYAAKFTLSERSIRILDKEMPIQIIEKWEVSIRPCELLNFARIFDFPLKSTTKHKEYKKLMRFLTATGSNLVDIMEFEDKEYQRFQSILSVSGKKPALGNLLDTCRKQLKDKGPGSNVIRYLLYKLNNKIIKSQLYEKRCGKLSNLYLAYQCIPFDEMPFNTSLLNHNPKLSDLFPCIDSSEREHEILARLIRNNTEIKGQLYTPETEITGFRDIDTLMQEYNSRLYKKHANRRLEKYKGHIYIKSYEDDTHSIIQHLIKLSSKPFQACTESVDEWVESSGYSIDCPEKKDALQKMLRNSQVALIYGSAGTGKSTLINHASHYWNELSKLYLANTHPAVNNLRRKIDADNCTFSTIATFINSPDKKNYDLLFIDECSTVSNANMLKVLTKAPDKLLVLVGDVYQIESIHFGNWFNVAHAVIPASAVTELTKPYRTTDPQLLAFWQKVRNIDEDISEHMEKSGYSSMLNESIFERSAEDEIILCLNYDGLYGINNINKYLQIHNANEPIRWGIHTYKVGDPILFNEINRFTPLLYNNLKGKITAIEVFDDRIQFDTEIEKTIDESEIENKDLSLVNAGSKGNSVVRFCVKKYRSTDDDDQDTPDNTVPFQIAYAVSIHKAQGLEYASVKVVITDEVEERITHNVFYTAVTRTKEKLKVYWTPETQKKILQRMVHKFNNKDVALLKNKFDF